jgi:hypothetical protein
MCILDIATTESIRPQEKTYVHIWYGSIGKIEGFRCVWIL